MSGERSGHQAPNPDSRPGMKSFMRSARQRGWKRLGPIRASRFSAPWLIAVFAQPLRILADGTRSPTYYAIESVRDRNWATLRWHSCRLVAHPHPESDGFP